MQPDTTSSGTTYRQNPLFAISALIDGPAVSLTSKTTQTADVANAQGVAEMDEPKSGLSDSSTAIGSSSSRATSPDTKTAFSPSSLPLSSSLSSSASSSRPPSQAGATSASREISCMNCKTTSTPLWRRDPASGAHLCNRCGLYLKTYNVMHPLTKIKRRAISVVANKRDTGNRRAGIDEPAAEMDDVEQVPRAPNCHPAQLHQVDVRVVQKRRITPKQQISLGMTPRCYNCSAEQTPLWRRDPEDNIICNACGLYYKLHGRARPVSMKRAAVKRRNRTTAAHHRDHGAETAGLSVPAMSPEALAEDGGEPDCNNNSSGGMVHGPATPKADASMGGLQFLMKAAELSPLYESSHIPKRSAPGDSSSSSKNLGSSGLGMLESLASVAAAEISTSSSSSATAASGQSEHKQELRNECQRLEQLLAQSKARLSKMC
ncbi:GATA type transcriptional activator of nitrogen-regulated proteins [Coemansia sp. RSA 1722]|nr:GATA type transcriptional activator of nitrogen-regulated proteins [Coemansia sp. RSA 486]KAJ2587777.1 GATA type transcriptional activator of nitrogen-regulated proteins [Coemansia sp. RSA 1722]KAJ2601453.1 GATA type transcriptional activator of nitrogen-regulated proteins [Coemansia sp. RSA 1721]KAJ2638715.1 GATA type transcriptional activator of nitrogen-regulated proteins [Coemansia sp. RSA 1286]